MRRVDAAALLLMGGCGPPDGHSLLGAGVPPPVDTDVPTVGVRDSGGTSEDCDVEALGDRARFVRVWPQVDTCRDGEIWLAPRTQDVLLLVRVPRSGTPLVPGRLGPFDLAAPPGGVEVVGAEGRNLFAGTCQGWDYPGIDPRPSHTWNPVEGELTFDIDTVTGPAAYTATLRWQGVVLARTDAPELRCALPDEQGREVRFEALSGS